MVFGIAERLIGKIHADVVSTVLLWGSMMRCRSYTACLANRELRVRAMASDASDQDGSVLSQMSLVSRAGMCWSEGRFGR